LAELLDYRVKGIMCNTFLEDVSEGGVEGREKLREGYF